MVWILFGDHISIYLFSLACAEQSDGFIFMMPNSNNRVFIEWLSVPV